MYIEIVKDQLHYFIRTELLPLGQLRLADMSDYIVAPTAILKNRQGDCVDLVRAHLNVSTDIEDCRFG